MEHIIKYGLVTKPSIKNVNFVKGLIEHYKTNLTKDLFCE